MLGIASGAGPVALARGGPGGASQRGRCSAVGCRRRGGACSVVTSKPFRTAWCAVSISVAAVEPHGPAATSYPKGAVAAAARQISVVVRDVDLGDNGGAPWCPDNVVCQGRYGSGGKEDQGAATAASP